MATIQLAARRGLSASRDLRLFSIILVIALTITLVIVQWSAAGRLPGGFGGADLSPSHSADYSRDTAKSPSRLAVLAPDPVSGQEHLTTQQVEATAPLAPLKPGVMGSGPAVTSSPGDPANTR